MAKKKRESKIGKLYIVEDPSEPDCPFLFTSLENAESYFTAEGDPSLLDGIKMMVIDWEPNFKLQISKTLVKL